MHVDFLDPGKTLAWDDPVFYELGVDSAGELTKG